MRLVCPSTAPELPGQGESGGYCGQVALQSGGRGITDGAGATGAIAAGADLVYTGSLDPDNLASAGGP